MADRVPDYEIKRRPRGLKVVFNCPVCSSVFTADALADAGNEHTCSCGRVLIIPGRQEADEYRRTEGDKRFQTAKQKERRREAAAAAKAEEARRKKYRDFISPPQAAAAERAARHVAVLGTILFVVLIVVGMISVVGGFVGWVDESAREIVALSEGRLPDPPSGVPPTLFLGGVALMMLGLVVGFAANAAAAQLRNAAHQTRLLAHLLDYAHHADVADHAPVQSTHPPTTPG